MIQIYVNLIKHGLKTLEEVPINIRLAVETAIAAESNI